MVIAGPALAAERPVDEKAMALFAKGIRHYEAGDFEKARQVLDEFIARNPGSKTALAVREKVEIDLLLDMQDEEKLAPTAEKLLAMMNRAARRMRREIPDLEKLLTDFQSPNENTYLTARVQMIGHGPYAVPHLLGFLTTQKAENQRVVARTIMTLRSMPREVCLPLIATLETDQTLLKTRVASILGQIGDRRALPALAAISQDPNATAPLVEAAVEAIHNIMPDSGGELAPAARLYEELVQKYLQQDPVAVGYVFGEEADIWAWNPAAPELADKLTCEIVPAYVYYQRQGAECALNGLALAPESPELKSLLVALMCRQLALAQAHAAGADSQEAARLADLTERVPMLCHVVDSSVAGGALLHTLSVGDGAASLTLVKVIGAKAGAQSGTAADALTAALRSTDKDVRYRASIEIVKLSPSGTIGDPELTMQVMSAALKYAATKTALVAVNDLQLRNELSAALDDQGLASIGCSADVGGVRYALSVEPAVDVVFLDGNVPENIFRAAYNKLKADARTGGAPLSVIVNPSKQAAKLSDYVGITRVLSPDHVRAQALEPLLRTALAEPHTGLGEQKADVILLAAQVLQQVDPETTKYPLAMLEPSLIGALRGYGEPVAMAATTDLARFGSEASLAPLGALLADTGLSVELKAAACRAIAVTAQRTGAVPGAGTVDALRRALGSDEPAIRQAAAEALGVAGLSPDEILELVGAYAP